MTRSELFGEKNVATRSLVAFEGWSSVRDRTTREHCPSHEIWSYKRDGRWRGWSFDRGSTVALLLYRPAANEVFSTQPHNILCHFSLLNMYHWDEHNVDGDVDLSSLTNFKYPIWRPMLLIQRLIFKHYHYIIVVCHIIMGVLAA